MNTPITYYGGKMRMIKKILPLIPEHNIYTEAFAGGAALLFAKEPVNINIINDLNGELINFYRTVKCEFRKLRKEIETTLHSREQHRVAWFIYNHPDYFDNVKRAWAVWTLSRMCFSGSFSGSFAVDKKSGMRPNTIANKKMQFDDELSSLLEKCTIEQDDAFEVIKRFDCDKAFHFVDPPYVGSCMGHYRNMFGEEDLEALLELLAGVSGKFMLTMYPNEKIREAAAASDWVIHKTQSTVSAKVGGPRRKQEEWMICNYA